MKVCLNMIVKNEAAIIERCLSSFVPHIACYVICDTGSTDGTQARIREFFEARGIPGVIVQIEFRDFAQARNEALQEALCGDPEFDYILLCDADMEFVCEALGELTEPAYSIITRDSGGITYPNTRLFHRGLEAVYRGVTHEYLDIGEWTPTLLACAHYVDHADGSNRTSKYNRDIALLRRGLCDEPGNVRYMFYLANTLYDLGRFREALQWYRRREAAGGWHEELFYSAYRSGQCLLRLERTSHGLAALLDTFDRFPHRAEPLHVIAMHCQRARKYKLSLAFAEMAREIHMPPDGLFVETDVYNWRLLDAKAVALYYLGDRKLAAACNESLLHDMAPESERERIAKNLAFCQANVATAAPPDPPVVPE